MRVWRGKEGGGRGAVWVCGACGMCGDLSVCSVRCGRVCVVCRARRGERGRGQGHSRRRGFGTAGEGWGLGTHVVLACPTCLQVLGVFTPLASWRLLSPTCCVSLHDAKIHAKKKTLVRIARDVRSNSAARRDRSLWYRNMCA